MKRMLVAFATAALAGLTLVVAASSATAPTAAEASDLQYMREEEKLARDVYQVLGAKWTTATVFQRIAQSEQLHMDAVKVALDRYGILDPAANTKQGEFVDPELQALYDRLVVEGSRSLAAALGVGVKIEEADISDLEQALAETSNPDLERLYGNLLRASKNHLQAFTTTAGGAPPAGASQRPAFGHSQGSGLRLGQGARLRDGTCLAE